MRGWPYVEVAARRHVAAEHLLIGESGHVFERDHLQVDAERQLLHQAMHMRIVEDLAVIAAGGEAVCQGCEFVRIHRLVQLLWQ